MHLSSHNDSSDSRFLIEPWRSENSGTWFSNVERTVNSDMCIYIPRYPLGIKVK